MRETKSLEEDHRPRIGGDLEVLDLGRSWVEEGGEEEEEEVEFVHFHGDGGGGDAAAETGNLSIRGFDQNGDRICICSEFRV